MKSGSKRSQMPAISAMSASMQACDSVFTGLPWHSLEHVIRQVEAEGFYAESLSTLRYGCQDHGECMLAIERWAADAGLKVSFNPDYGICFFERHAGM